MSNVAQSETAFPVLEALARRIAADYALAERLVARARRSGLNAAALAEGHDLKDVPLLTAVARIADAFDEVLAGRRRGSPASAEPG
ncbi:hypothetical protein [Tistrella mobilis]|uniref:Uncharacterized protein n=1 Tax=Tistrella mobilis (strain KA081020-065) TaxID=1110502 RepID=I3TRS2_TISMK|nr:hypothetical protein [Tistrella mobilis]AFK55460.1 hypothetical protein TMO_a0057 [Tistrella mobilis KA081020-065]MAM73515.1 hypothetical protein [Tistrella sp.]